MKAIIATAYGPPEVLQLADVATPTPNDHEVLIKVHASTVNVGDCRMRSFRVPPLFWLPGRLALGVRKPKRPIVGMELAGEVVAVGAQVRRFKAGDQVFASTLEDGFGAHAEYKCLPEDGAIAALPAGMTFAEAATLALGANTALFFLRAGHIQPGQKILINGASGSVGTFAVQLAKYFGAEVAAVCSARNAALVQSLGADRVIDYKREDWAHSGERYDILFDAVGTTSLPQCRDALKPGGYYLHTVMVLPGAQQRWYALTSGQLVVGGTAVPRREALEFLKARVEAGQLNPVIDRCYSLAQMAEAHRYVDSGHKVGNVVVAVA